MVAVRAVAWNIILARELRDLAHLFDGVVVIEVQLGDAVARRRRHRCGVGGVAAPGVDAFRGASSRWRCGLYESRRYRRGPICRGPSSSAPTVDCALCYKFEPGVLPASCACKHCLCAMRTSELSHTQDQCFKQHGALGLPKKPRRGLKASASVMLRRGHRCRAERLARGGPRRPPGRRAPS